MLTAAEINDMRATLAETRTDECVVLRYTEDVDEAGGAKPDWQSSDTLPCRVSPQGMQAWEQIDKTEGKTVSTSVWWIALPPGTQVDPADRLQVGERIFEVIAARAPRTVELEQLIQCALIDAGGTV